MTYSENEIRFWILLYIILDEKITGKPSYLKLRKETKLDLSWSRVMKKKKFQFIYQTVHITKIST